MSSSRDVFQSHVPPVTSLEYRDLRKESQFSPSKPEPAIVEPDTHSPISTLSLTEEELSVRISDAQKKTAAEIAQCLGGDYERKLDLERSKIADAITGFARERSEYYSQVESELVQLALAIAGKILHREAQVDRLLLAALVKIAIENLQHRSNISVRVRPEVCAEWREYFMSNMGESKVEVLEDSGLEPSDCVLETELGTANLSLDAQLKEVERGLFDLLAHRPDTAV